MDTLLGQSESVRTPASMTERVLADAKRTYDGVVDDAVLERFAREAVDELCGDSIKVTTFVPVLAMRRVRDLLDAGQSTAIETAATV